jgi:hypothetical protein
MYEVEAIAERASKLFAPRFNDVVIELRATSGIPIDPLTTVALLRLIYFDCRLFVDTSVVTREREDSRNVSSARIVLISSENGSWFAIDHWLVDTAANDKYPKGLRIYASDEPPVNVTPAVVLTCTGTAPTMSKIVTKWSVRVVVDT